MNQIIKSVDLIPKSKVLKSQIFAVFFILTGIFLVNCTPATIQKQDYFPTDGWREATPESQGMSSEKLNSMIKYIDEQRLDVDNIIIIRNGYLVFEASRYPYIPEIPHLLYSCTKSFVSTLIGITIDQGLIQSVDQKLVDFFPDKVPEDIDPLIKQVTIKHLLTMSAGFEPERRNFNPGEIVRFRNEDDITGAILKSKLYMIPGEKFIYSNICTYLLGAIVSNVSGVSLEEYAVKNLLNPLNITQYRFDKESNGHDQGYSGLYLQPRDFAKLGLLFLNGGQWDKKSIVSASWIKEAKTSWINVPDNDQTSNNHFPDYGYQWWIDGDNRFAAQGSASQLLHMDMEHDLIIAINGSMSDFNMLKYQAFQYLDDSFILNNVGLKPLKKNVESEQLLNKSIEDWKDVPPVKVADLPEISTKISEKQYPLEENDFGFESFTFSFTPLSASLQYSEKGKIKTLPIGLEGRYLSTKIDQYTYACRGSWEGDKFMFQMRNIDQGYSANFSVIFDGDKIEVSVIDNFSAYSFSGESLIKVNN